MSALQPQLAWLPSGKPDWHHDWINGHARGLDLVLNHLGDSVDFVTIMGDIGQAFLMQGEELNRRDNGGIDVGWWPLEPMCLMRLSFVGAVVGRELKEIRIPESASEDAKSDPVKAFKTWFEPSIRQSLTNGIPCIVTHVCTQYIITGIDDNEHPLMGMCPNEKTGEEKITRINEPLPPWVLVTVGGKTGKIDRKQADLEALSFAVALHKESVLGPEGGYSSTFPLSNIDGYKKSKWHTGKKSFVTWIECLEDSAHIGPHYWYANARSHLESNRKVAVLYLREMQKRHTGEFAAHLEAACGKYDAVVAELKKADTSDEAVKSAQGRASLIRCIRTVAALEAEAIAEVEKALAIGR